MKKDYIIATKKISTLGSITGQSNTFSKDEIKELEDQLQKLTDKFGKDIDKLVEAKSKEIMTV